MLSRSGLLVLYLVFGVLLFFTWNKAKADDLGITKARLIQITDTSYMLEADVPQILLSTIKKPVFPERFRFTDFEYTNQSGWITLQMAISTSGAPLSKEDEILLPWLRTGVDFSTQWKDGSTFKGLYNRSLKGIIIPLSEVMPSNKSTKEVLTEGFLMGLHHIGFKSIHILFILCLTWVIPKAKLLKLLLWWSFGQGVALIFADFRLPTTGIVYGELLITIIILVIAYAVAYQKELRYLWGMLFIAGLIHGLSFNHEITGASFSNVQRIQALFSFNLVLDIAHFLLAFLFIGLLPFAKNVISNQHFSKAAGSVSVLLMLLVFNDHVSIGNTDILSLKASTAKSIKMPAPAKQSTQQIQRGTGFMTTPIMAYLSVEPYQIRQEVLIKLSEAVKIIDPNYKFEKMPVERQEQLLSNLTGRISSNSFVLIDGQSIQSVEVIANFVRLSRGGVTIREAPIDEDVSEGIIGITYIYDIPSFPKTIHYDWQYFPESVEKIEASIVDPHGAFTAILTLDDHQIHWKNRLSGFQLPTVEPIQIKAYPLPILSIIVWMIIVGIIIYQIVKKKRFRFNTVIILLLIIGFMIYPFLRFQRALPFLSDWKPSNERTSIILNDLLTNVYRAFDRRKENDVYDRLAMSVSGDQLTDIYLHNRQAMALENRGGARAKVDEISILQIYEVKHAESEGFIVDAGWTVRGSVNHFGHTHYRQNQYRALITLIDDNAFWKIGAIETIDEKRIY